MHSLLQRHLVDLKGVGAKLANTLRQLNMITFYDLLLHFPYKYIDKTRITSINDLLVDDTTSISGIIHKIQKKLAPKPHILIEVSDDSGSIEIILYTYYSHNNYQLNQRICCFGQVKKTRGKLRLYHPDIEIVSGDRPIVMQANLTPLYPATQGITSKTIQKLIQQVLTICEPISQQLEWFTGDMLNAFNLVPFYQAMCIIHQPTAEISLEELNNRQHTAQLRFTLEELAAHRLCYHKYKQHHKTLPAPVIPASQTLVPRLLESLAFTLTSGQQAALQEIFDDLTKPYPMRRLIQGEVGCGKTLVALLSALTVIEYGYQVAFMAPTDLLAEQHYHNLTKLCQHLNINIGSLRGKMTAKEKLNGQQRLLTGQTDLLIGTHALFQKGVEFAKLGLVIIDEQHRFGVEQRLALMHKAKQANAHQLLLSATPIPRSLAMSFYADLDLTEIRSTPKNRLPITTLLIKQSRRQEICQRILTLCKQDQQVYWVCPLIADSEVLTCQAAESTAEYLRSQLTSISIACIHGKLPNDEKQATMRDFVNGNTQLLVATTVIEVGIDVARATLIVIENPERMGLSQLHQLRGRVGRGELASYCILLYPDKLSSSSQQRLQLLKDASDGFAIAEADLKLRGPGQWFGRQQSGAQSFKIATWQQQQQHLNNIIKLSQLIEKNTPEKIELLIKSWLANGIEFSSV